MNPEHVEKVRAVGMACRAVWSEEANEKYQDFDTFMQVMRQAGDRIWAEHFPPQYMEKYERLDLENADLSGLVFAGGRLLKEANLEGANLDNTHWYHTNLEWANCKRASFRGAELAIVNANEANFWNADFSGSRVTLLGSTRCGKSDFTNATINLLGVVGEMPDVSGANMTGCKINLLMMVMGRKQLKPNEDLVLRKLSPEQKSQITLVREWDKPAAPVASQSTQRSGGSGCFVATAAYGTDTAAEVIILRSFRDTVLKQNALGQGFIAIYEKVSPPVSRMIASSPTARLLVRRFLIKPLCRLVGTRDNLGLES
ncbi:MAG: pentapeptide repeat-containing protein [Desulfomonilaceae bacterium]